MAEYLNNTDLEKVIQNYKDDPTLLNAIPVIQMCHTIAEAIVKYTKFTNIPDKVAIDECVLIACQKIMKHDPKKGKAFNLLTTIMLNHLRQLYRKNLTPEKKKAIAEMYHKKVAEKKMAKKKKAKS